METRNKDAEYIKSLCLLGFVRYFPLARNSPSDMDDLDCACREAMNERLSPAERGRALGEVEAILRRLEDE